MESASELTELTERIRYAVMQQGGGVASASAESLARGELPPIPEKLAPPAMVTSQMYPGSTQETAESRLDVINSMIARARSKNSVPEGIPAILKPFFRNQGGVNGVMVETLDRLVSFNQQLRQQNAELQERLLALHGWVNAATQVQARNRDWMMAADARLRMVSDARLSQLEDRLRGLEEQGLRD